MFLVKSFPTHTWVQRKYFFSCKTKIFLDNGNLKNAENLTTTHKISVPIPTKKVSSFYQTHFLSKSRMYIARR